MCHKIPRFIEKSKRAGVTRVFIGLENVNPDNLIAAKKKQNKITEYRKMLLDWKAQGIFVYAGYILGFPGDTPESIRRDIAIIKRELPLDMLEFNILTPLPGSEDHKVLWKKGVDMDADLNKYDLEHAVTDHPRMKRLELEAIYQEAWSIYYTPEHIETLLRRAIVTDIPLLSFIKVLVQFTTMMQVEKVHPLQSGLFRLKHRSERRPGLPDRICAGILSALRLGPGREQSEAGGDHLANVQSQAPHRARSEPIPLHGSGAHAGTGRRRGYARSPHQDRRCESRDRAPKEGGGAHRALSKKLQTFRTRWCGRRNKTRRNRYCA